MILPFVKLYTDGVTDLNYIDFFLPLLFCGIQILSGCRITSENLIKIAGHAKQTISRAVMEIVINLVASILLVQVIGVYGVLLGTILALLYRTNDMILYANHRILKRSSWRTYRTLITNFALFAIIALISHFVRMEIDSLFLFFVIAGGCFTIFTILFVVTNSVIDRASWKHVSSKILSAIRAKKNV